MDKLTRLQEEFANQYAIDGNGTQATHRARMLLDMDITTDPIANDYAHSVLCNPMVQAHIAMVKDLALKTAVKDLNYYADRLDKLSQGAEEHKQFGPAGRNTMDALQVRGLYRPGMELHTEGLKLVIEREDANPVHDDVAVDGDS